MGPSLSRRPPVGPAGPDHTRELQPSCFDACGPIDRDHCPDRPGRRAAGTAGTAASGPAGINKKLIRGVQLELLHPEVVNRDCSHCIRFVYEEEGPLIGQVKMWRGQPLERPPGTVPLCRREGCRCPKGSPENPVVLSPRNRQAFQFHMECRLTGRWPEDALVIERGVLLEQLLRDVDQIQQMKLLTIAGPLKGPNRSGPWR